VPIPARPGSDEQRLYHGRAAGSVSRRGYDIAATIDGNYKFSARTTTRLVSRRDGQQWAPLRLYSELHVDSGFTGVAMDEPLTIYRRDHQTLMWVRFRNHSCAEIRLPYVSCTTAT